VAGPRVRAYPAARALQITADLKARVISELGRPLISYQVIINSIAATTTSAGLKVYARLDQRDYLKKVEVTDAQLAAVNLTSDPFHPEWNYTIAPCPNPAG
jgi:hypothetical protein